MLRGETAFSKYCVTFLFGIALQPLLTYSESVSISSKYAELGGSLSIHLSKVMLISVSYLPSFAT